MWNKYEILPFLRFFYRSDSEITKTWKKDCQNSPFSYFIIFPLSFYQLSNTLFGETPILFGKTLYNLAKLQAFAKLYRVLPNCIGFCQIVWGFCQMVSLLPNRMRFCQMVSLTLNCIRLSPNRSYFLAKEPQNRSSPTLECKIAPKNTRK